MIITPQEYPELKLHETLFRESPLTPTVRCRISPPSVGQKGLIMFTCPPGYNFETADFQCYARKAIDAALKQEAELVVPAKLDAFGRQSGLRHTALKFRSMRTRWGSCDWRGGININTQCMRLPEELLDYVLWHELCHTREHNHQAGFWKLMEEVLPGARVLNRKLRGYKTGY